MTTRRSLASMRRVGAFLLGLPLLGVAACGDTNDVSTDEPTPSWYGRTRGSAVVLSRDEQVAVVTNRSAGVVTVFKLDPDAPLDQIVLSQTEISMGARSEPWAAVIGADDDTAYVISRFDKAVTRIVHLHGTPERDLALPVGSEPTAIVMQPGGNRLFVANYGDGTISIINTPEVRGTRRFEVGRTLDLNEALVSTGVLGDVEPRPGLAHPRALAITDDGDDEYDDETLYATEFFSMPLPAAGASGEPGSFDRNRQGFVYPIPFAEDGRVLDPISIAPVQDTGFPDSNGAWTGCFPNQLYAAAVAGNRLFVTSVCASPEGPLNAAMGNSANFKTLMHPVVFAIDTQTNLELPALRQVLSREIEERYASESDFSLRMPLIPNDIAFTAPSELASGAPRTACITAMGADAVFCTHHDETGRMIDIGLQGKPYLDLAPHDQRAGRLPIGIALSTRRPFGLVVSDNSQMLSVLDLEENRVRHARRAADTIDHAAAVRGSEANAGRLRFATGLDVWSFGGEAWASCESCHPDGLSDGVTWFFARGPRRTISTAGTYYGEGDRRVMLWTGNIDEIHDVEIIARTVAGGIGGVLWNYPINAELSNDLRIVYDGTMGGKPTSILRNGLNASLAEILDPADAVDICVEDSMICDRSAVRDWDQIDAYVRSVRAPLRPSADDAQALRGRDLFVEGRCAGCHGGPGWTLSRVFYTPGATNNGALPFSTPPLVTDEQLGLLRIESYSVPPELQPLNPPGSLGTATFRRWDPGGNDRVTHLYGTMMESGYDSAKKTHGNDQINCVLRAVGTFPDQSNGENLESIVLADSPSLVREVRQDMTTMALGAQGFNIPSLLGVAMGAPYFHAGNARTLEELFDPTFARHHQALTPGFLEAGEENRSDRVRDLIAYLLSIDDNKPELEIDPYFDLCTPMPGSRIQ